MFKRPKIGLALGGGGARGMAHIGVLKVLEQGRIPIDIITGTSAGSIIGAMYAQNPSSSAVEQRMRGFLASKEYKYTGIEFAVKKQTGDSLFAQLTENIKERIVINVACSRKSIVGNKRLKKALAVLIDEGNIQDTKIKLGIAASDLVSGRGVLFTRDDIHIAVMASSSIPGFLPPVELNGQQLIDGVVIHPVPVQAALDLGAEVVIAVDASPSLTIENKFDNIIDIVMRNSQMVGNAYAHLLLKKSDVVIRPKVGQYHWAEFNRFDKIIKLGEEAAQKALPRMRMVSRASYLLMKKMNLW